MSNDKSKKKKTNFKENIEKKNLSQHELNRPTHYLARI